MFSAEGDVVKFFHMPTYIHLGPAEKNGRYTGGVCLELEYQRLTMAYYSFIVVKGAGFLCV